MSPGERSAWANGYHAAKEELVPYKDRQQRRDSDKKRYWEFKLQVAGEDLKKVTLNLFLKDVEWLQDRYGWGMSEIIRNCVRRYIKQIKDEENGK